MLVVTPGLSDAVEISVRLNFASQLLLFSTLLPSRRPPPFYASYWLTTLASASMAYVIVNHPTLARRVHRAPSLLPRKSNAGVLIATYRYSVATLPNGIKRYTTGTQPQPFDSEYCIQTLTLVVAFTLHSMCYELIIVQEL